MIPYLITFGITIVLTLLAEILIKNKQKLLGFIIIGLAIFVLSFLAGVRNDEVGKDIGVYVTPVFEWAQEMKFEDYIERGDIEKGYKIFVFAMTKIFNNYHVILFTMQAIIATAVYIFAYKNREKVSITLLILTYLLIFYNDTLTMMRQSIAMGFILISIITFKEKKYIKTTILYLLAIVFQNTAIIGILIYLIIAIDNTTKINKRSKFLLNSMIIIAFFTCVLLYQEILYIFTYDMPILPEKYFEYLSSSYYNESGISISKSSLIFKGIWIFIAIYMSQLTKKQDIKTYTKFLAIDLGISNLASCIVTNNESFIIDGKKLKSINQFYNKQKAYYQSKLPQGTKYSNRLRNLDKKRNRQVEDYLNKAVATIITKAIESNIDEIIIGWNNYIKTDGIKNDDLKGKDKRRVNQSFVQIPLSRFKDKLVFKCRQKGIKTVVINESYTSKSSFYDNDPIIKGKYSGTRISRGLYQTKDKRIINADINAALNIYKKAVITCNSTNNKIDYLMSRGLTIPNRILVKL